MSDLIAQLQQENDRLTARCESLDRQLAHLRRENDRLRKSAAQYQQRQAKVKRQQAIGNRQQKVLDGEKYPTQNMPLVEVGSGDSQKRDSETVACSLFPVPFFDKELRKSEQRFRELFEASNDNIHFLEFDPPIPLDLPIEEQIDRIYRDSRFTDVNPACMRSVGLNRSEIIGRSLAIFHHPDSQAHRSLLRRMIENGWQITGAESDDVDSNGSKRYWLSHLFCSIENGCAVRAWGVTNNITCVKKLEQALLAAEQERTAELERLNFELQQSEERYRLVTLATKEAICDYNIATQQIDWYEGSNSPFGHTTGQPSRAVDLDWWLSLIHPDDRDRISQQAHIFFEGAADRWLNEYRFQRADGTYARVLDAGIKVRNAAGQPRRVLGAVMDITAQREAEAALHAEIAERRRAEQLARGQTDVLVKTLAVLAEHPILDNFLGYVLQAITEQLGDFSGGIWLYDEQYDTTILHLNYEDGQIQQGSQIARPGTVDRILRQWDLEFLPALREQKVLIQEVEQFPHQLEYALSKSYHRPRVQRILVIALFFGETFFGNVTLRRTTPHPYTPEEVELARALAHQATLAIQLIRLIEQSRQTAVLEERNRLASEIHDTIAQGLMGIIAQLQAADQRQKHNLGDFQQHLHVARQLAKDCLTEARRSVWALRPHILDSNTLSDAIAYLAHQMTAHAGIALHLNLQPIPAPLPPLVEDHLLRIAQEALANTLKHAQAESVWIALEIDSQVRLSIRDNGQGFDPNRVTTGFGLTSLRSRAQLIQAQLTIHSQPEVGTSITALVPLNWEKRR